MDQDTMIKFIATGIRNTGEIGMRIGEAMRSISLNTEGDDGCGTATQ